GEEPPGAAHGRRRRPRGRGAGAGGGRLPPPGRPRGGRVAAVVSGGGRPARLARVIASPPLGLRRAPGAHRPRRPPRRRAAWLCAPVGTVRGVPGRRLLPVLARRPRRPPPGRPRSVLGRGATRDRPGRPLRRPRHRVAAGGHGLPPRARDVLVADP